MIYSMQYIYFFIMKLRQYLSSWGVIITMLCATAVPALQPAQAHVGTHDNVDKYQEEIKKLKEDIQTREKNLEQLRKDSQVYEKTVRQKQEQAQTLNGKLEVIENKLAKVLTDIRIKEAEIAENKDEIQQLSEAIQLLNLDIEKNKHNIGHYLRLIHQNDQKDSLHALLVDTSFSNFFAEIEYVNDLHSDLQHSLELLQEEKYDLEQKQDLLAKKNEQLEEFKLQLVQKTDELQEEQDLQSYYLRETKLSEEKYQQLLWRTKQEEAAIQNEINAYERTIRKRLEEIEAAEKKKRDEGQTENLKLGSSRFQWPVNPARGITAEFHDPDYPFRHIFEHSGIDVRASQGTPIRAAESGYVARTRLPKKGFGYVMIIHSDGLSTLYGHVSRLLVSPDTYVNKGDIIAYSGGLPGTPGAGLSTGPHLHFEIRVNGIPVNPRKYLP